MISRFRFGLVLSLFLLPLIFSVGCTSGAHLRPFRDELVPRAGNPLNPKFVEELQAMPSEQRANPRDFPIRRFDRSVWLLPYFVSKMWVGEIPFEGEEGTERAPEAPYIEAATQKHFNLGLPGLGIPLYHRTSESVWSGEPDTLPAEASYTLTPFWVWQKETKPEGDENFQPGFSGRASGIPLFFWQTHHTGRPWHFQPLNPTWEGRREQYSWSTLLGLGPTYELATEELPIQGPLDANIYWSSKIFTPLGLGGFLGKLLWSDYRYWASVPGGQTMQVGHGPLFGLPLYTYTESRVTDNQPEWMKEPIFDHQYQHARRILFGVLWADVKVEGDPKQAEYRNYHNKGILWTAFGWGHDEDSKNIRFLWFNIPYKKYKRMVCIPGIEKDK